MLKRSFLIFCVLAFTSVVLITSILRVASVRYSYTPVNPNVTDDKLADNMEREKTIIDYQLASPGSVLPDHPLWKLKALRDRIWALLLTDGHKKSELNLLFADKRVASSQILFEKRDYELAMSTLTKAEKYFRKAVELEEEVRSQGRDTGELVTRISKASLKHRQVINEIKLIAPEQMLSDILPLEEYLINTYNSYTQHLRSIGFPVPPNPI